MLYITQQASTSQPGRLIDDVNLPFSALPAQEVLYDTCLSGEVSYNYTYLFDALVAKCGL